MSSIDRSCPFGKFHAHLAYLMFVVVETFRLTTIFNPIINSPLCQLKGETTSDFMNHLHWNFELPPLSCMRVTSLYAPPFMLKRVPYLFHLSTTQSGHAEKTTCYLIL